MSEPSEYHKLLTELTIAESIVKCGRSSIIRRQAGKDIARLKPLIRVARAEWKREKNDVGR